MKKNFDTLAKDTRRVDAQFGEFEGRVADMLSEFKSQFGYIYDDNTENSISKMMDMLKDRADCYFAPRSRFREIAQIRKHTMTPPGFKDDHEATFSYGQTSSSAYLFALNAANRANFSKVVFLTNDQKPDWSTRGTPHPILIAEVGALFGTPFALWNLDTFGLQVQLAVGN